MTNNKGKYDAGKMALGGIKAPTLPPKEEKVREVNRAQYPYNQPATTAWPHPTAQDRGEKCGLDFEIGVIPGPTGPAPVPTKEQMDEALSLVREIKRLVDADNTLEGWEKKLDALWNEHDGTHFYKDEFREFIKSLLSLQAQELTEDVVKRVEELKEKQATSFGTVDSPSDYNDGVSDAIAVIRGKNEKR